MAFFSKKTKEKKEVLTEVKNTVPPVRGASRLITRKGVDVSAILRKPMITEKAMQLAEKGVYVFEVLQDATKIDVTQAVKKLFNVSPRKVNIVRRRPVVVRKMLRGGVRGRSRGYKKAMVFLNKGDKIELV